MTKEGFMKTLGVVLLLLFATAPLSLAQQSRSSATQTRLDGNTSKEVLEMEKQLGRAMAPCDAVLLAKLLADYFADSYGDSEKAGSKGTTLARCRAGVMTYYAIDKHRRLIRRGNIVVVAGVSNSKPQTGTDNKEEERFRIERFWTRVDGRWQLISQTRERLEEKEEGRKK
jgi:hypothetical protein